MVNAPDPLAISSAVLAFRDAGGRIKDSIDIISQNRQRLRDLANDALEDLNALFNFTTMHGERIERNAPELKESVEGLSNQLYHVASRCQHLAQQQSQLLEDQDRPPQNNDTKGRMSMADSTSSVLRRVRRGFKAWRESGDIETELARLKELTQQCVARFLMCTSARSEVILRSSRTGYQDRLLTIGTGTGTGTSTEVDSELLGAANPLEHSGSFSATTTTTTTTHRDPRRPFHSASRARSAYHYPAHPPFPFSGPGPESTTTRDRDSGGRWSRRDRDHHMRFLHERLAAWAAVHQQQGILVESEPGSAHIEEIEIGGPAEDLGVDAIAATTTAEMGDGAGDGDGEDDGDSGSSKGGEWSIVQVGIAV